MKNRNQTSKWIPNYKSKTRMGKPRSQGDNKLALNSLRRLIGNGLLYKKPYQCIYTLIWLFLVLEVSVLATTTISISYNHLCFRRKNQTTFPLLKLLNSSTFKLINSLSKARPNRYICVS